MKTILAAKENIAQLWGFPKPKETAYRLMKYLIRVEVEGGILLHNCVTRQLLFLTKEEAEILSKLPAKPTEPMKELIANHFLVPVDFDEYKTVKQLRSIYQTRQNRATGSWINHYVILPTTFCNAHCFYCYESDYPHIHMTEETARKLIDYIDEHHKGNQITLDWFGGEPLVGLNRIEQISQGLKDRGIDFTSYMISNGYLFDEEIIQRSVKLWNLKRVQITLDGTEEVYNRVKAYAGVRDNPFRHVLGNIDLLSANGIHVNIRLNVDFYNKDDIWQLIGELGERYSGKKNISVYLNMLFNNQGFEPVHHSTDDRIELSEIIERYTERLRELKLSQSRRNIPSLSFSQCMADNPHTVEIQPDGSFCRCEHENVNDSYGNIVDGILNPMKILEWRETIERSDHCSECCVFPACYMLRGCMNADAPCIDSIRLKYIEEDKERIRSIYQNKQEDEENEEICSS